MAAYGASVHDAAGYAPNFLGFERELHAPLDIVFGPPKEKLLFGKVMIISLLTSKNLGTLLMPLKKITYGDVLNSGKRVIDLHVHKQDIKAGTWVWYYYPSRWTGKSTKWTHHYAGLILVIKVLSLTNVYIQKRMHAKPQVVHVDKQKPC